MSRLFYNNCRSWERSGGTFPFSLGYDTYLERLSPYLIRAYARRPSDMVLNGDGALVRREAKEYTLFLIHKNGDVVFNPDCYIEDYVMSRIQYFFPVESRNRRGTTIAVNLPFCGPSFIDSGTVVRPSAVVPRTCTNYSLAAHRVVLDYYPAAARQPLPVTPAAPETVA